MAGIQLEQLDLISVGKYFAAKKDIADQITREAIVEKLEDLTPWELTTMGIELTQSEQVVRDDSTIDVTESDGTEYHIAPTRGYVNFNDRDTLVYQHPLTHNANEITPTTDRQFSSTLEKQGWNNKPSKQYLDNEVLSSEQRLTQVFLNEINILLERIRDIEEEIGYERVEKDRRELVTNINSVLANYCSLFIVLGDGTSTTYTINHNLNTQNIQAIAVESYTGEVVYPTFTIEDNNNLSVRFLQPVEVNVSYNIIITANKEIYTAYQNINAALMNICQKYIVYGDGVNREFTISHDRNTRDIIINVVDSATNEIVECTQTLLVEDNQCNKVKVKFTDPLPEGNAYFVYITSQPTAVTAPTGDRVFDLSMQEYINTAFNRVCQEFTLTKAAGETIKTVTHNLDTKRVNIAVYKIDTDSYELVFPSYTLTDNNNIAIDFISEVEGDYYVVINCDTQIDYPME